MGTMPDDLIQTGQQDGKNSVHVFRAFSQTFPSTFASRFSKFPFLYACALRPLRLCCGRFVRRPVARSERRRPVKRKQQKRRQTRRRLSAACGIGGAFRFAFAFGIFGRAFALQHQRRRPVCYGFGPCLWRFAFGGLWPCLCFAASAAACGIGGGVSLCLCLCAVCRI